MPVQQCALAASELTEGCQPGPQPGDPITAPPYLSAANASVRLDPVSSRRASCEVKNASSLLETRHRNESVRDITPALRSHCCAQFPLSSLLYLRLSAGGAAG